ncbi:MAG: hypothetical protein ACI4U2_00535 [Christensenellaceae bacterium]
MSEKTTGILLEAIQYYCKDGGYRIVEEGELLDYFPDRYLIGADELHAKLKRLEECGYIDVRYSDEKLCCLCLLPEGKLVLDHIHREETERSVGGKNFSWLLCFVGGLVGGIIGGFVGALLI